MKFVGGSLTQSSDSADAFITTFKSLTDAISYTAGDANKVVQINSAGTGLQYGFVLGTASTATTGVSGHTIPFLDGTNTWSAVQAFSNNVTVNGTLTRAGNVVYDAGNLAFGAGLTFSGGVLSSNISSLDASNIVGVLAPVKGGTGISSYTVNNYVRAANANTLEQRTPDQVLRDISAIKSTADTSPPLSAVIGDRWVDSTSLIEYVYFDDGDSQQWVQFGSSGTQYQSMYIQPNKPTNAIGPYMWIQTALNGSTDDFTIWFEDGI